ncbi:hypothetical protein Bca4012_014744 [Brassica carinata]
MLPSAYNRYGSGRRYRNARKAVFFCTSNLPPGDRRDNISHATMKRIMKFRSKSSSSRTSKQLGSSSKEEDAAPNDQVQSQILGSSSKEDDAAPSDQAQSQILGSSSKEEDAAPSDQVQSQMLHLSLQEEEDVV